MTATTATYLQNNLIAGGTTGLLTSGTYYAFTHSYGTGMFLLEGYTAAAGRRFAFTYVANAGGAVLMGGGA